MEAVGLTTGNFMALIFVALMHREFSIEISRIL